MELNEHRAAQLVAALLIGGYVPDYLRERAQQVVDQFDQDMRDVQIDRLRALVSAHNRAAVERSEAAAAATEVGIDNL